ncbi:hypothetical protein [Streptomyces sp. NPDC002172]
MTGAAHERTELPGLRRRAAGSRPWPDFRLLLGGLPPTRLPAAAHRGRPAGVEPYEFLTEVELRPAAGGGTHVTTTADAMHDEECSGRLAAGRANERDNLAGVAGS